MAASDGSYVVRGVARLSCDVTAVLEFSLGAAFAVVFVRRSRRSGADTLAD